MARVKLHKEEQRIFLNRVAAYFDFDWFKIAKISNICERSLRDWRSEKYNMNYEALLRLQKIADISIPKKIKILPEYWSTKKASRLGAIKRNELYGNPGTSEGRRKGGIISQRRFHASPDYAKRLGFKIRKQIKYPRKSSLLAEFVGILLGDGGISRFQVHITFNRETDRKYAHFIQKVIKNLFSIPSFIVSGGISDKGDDIAISSRNLVEFLQKLGLPQGNKVRNKVDIPNWIKENNIYAIACVRGLMDTDGSFCQYEHKVNGKNYVNFSTCFTNYSISLLNSVYMVLEKIGISSIRRSRNRIYIHRKQDIENYFDVVGTNNPKHLEHYRRYLALDNKNLKWRKQI